LNTNISSRNLILKEHMYATAMKSQCLQQFKERVKYQVFILGWQELSLGDFSDLQPETKLRATFKHLQIKEQRVISFSKYM